MATYYWIGGHAAAEGDFNNVNNWEESGVTPAAKPGAADDIVFDGRAGINPDNTDSGQTIGTNWSVTTSLAQGVNFASITVADDFTGNIGYTDSGVNYPLQCSADAVTIAGSGSYYLEADGDNFDAVTMYDPAAVYLTADAAETSGTVSVFGGELTSEIDATTLTVLDGLVTISGDVGTLTAIDGTIYFEGDITTKLTVINADVYAGLLSTSSDVTSDIASAEINGGTFRWRTSGRITAMTINGGTTTTTGAASKYLGHSANATTITVNAGTLNLQAGAPVQLGALTVIKCIGTVIVPNGEDISW